MTLHVSTTKTVGVWKDVFLLMNVYHEWFHHPRGYFPYSSHLKIPVTRKDLAQILLPQ